MLPNKTAVPALHLSYLPYLFFFIIVLIAVFGSSGIATTTLALSLSFDGCTEHA